MIKNEKFVIRTIRIIQTNNHDSILIENQQCSESKLQSHRF